MKYKIKLSCVLCIVIALCVLFCGKVEAKASNEPEKNFANVVLFAHFAGSEANDDAKFFEDNRDKIIKIYNGTNGRSVVNYLNTISYGKFHIKNIFPQDNGQKIISYELPFNKQSAYDINIDYSIIKNMIANIPGVTDKVIDYDGDGYIDNLTIVIRGGDKRTDSNSTFICHKSDYFGDETWAGKKVGCYNIINTYSMMETLVANESGVIVHEFLHTLKYPDLYRGSGVDDYPVSTWDIMASANRYMPYPLAYLRMYCTNWLDIETITTNKTVTLHEQSNKDGNQAYIIKSPLNEYELFVIEFRKRAEFNINDEDTLDRGIGGSGIIVYRVNTTVTRLSNNFGQTGVYVFRPKEVINTDNTDRVLVTYAYLSAESGRTSIGSSDMSKTIEGGALTFSDGTNSGIVISDISSSAGNSMTCKITVPDKSNFDMWEDTSYNDTTSSINNQFNIVSFKDKIYMVNKIDNNVYTQTYENKTWKNIGVSYNESLNITQIELIDINNTLYMCYVGYNASYEYCLKIKKWNEQTLTWEDFGTVNNINNDFGVGSFNGKLYITLVQSNSKNAKLICVDQGNIKELGTYFANNLCGQPKIQVINNQIYVSVRQADGEKIKLFKYNDVNNFTEIINDMSTNTYDMVALQNKLYFSIGKSNGANLKIYTFDGANWNTIDTNISYGFPQLIVTQGKLYLMASTIDGNGNTKVFEYIPETGSFEQEGIDVESSAYKKYLVATNGRLYAAIQRNIDYKIVVKSKDTVNKLLSLTITPPDKTTYIVGESIKKDGLKVVANYTKGSKDLDSSSYTISNFNTSSIGSYNATISFGGITNTFSYEVVKLVEENNNNTSNDTGNNNNTTNNNNNNNTNNTNNSNANNTGNTSNTNNSNANNTGNTSNTNNSNANNTGNTSNTNNSNANNTGNTSNTNNSNANNTSNKTNTTTNNNNSNTNTTNNKNNTANSSTTTNNAIANNIALNSINLNKTNITMNEKETQNLTVTYNPTNTTENKNVTWTSSNNSIAVVDANGKVTAINKGTTTITAKVGTKTATCIVNVKVPSINVSYSTHIQNIGWQNEVKDGAVAGTTGKALRLEGIKISLLNKKYSGDIEYRTHIQNIGWETTWKKDKNMSGTQGKSLRLEAIQIRLTGELANKYDVYYRVHAQNFGWLDWAKNGESAGTTGYAYRLEAIQIIIVEKGAKAPGDTINPFYRPMIEYSTHVQDIGWGAEVKERKTAGTVGKALRLEAIKINLLNQEYSGNIEYRTHIQDIGWEKSWKRNKMMSGTQGRSLRVEAIQIRLTGEMANKYDIYYRVHAQNFGWFDWAKNGESAGTAGYCYRLEAIEIVLVKKGGKAPGNTNVTFKQK